VTSVGDQTVLVVDQWGCNYVEHFAHGVQQVCDLADHTAHGVQRVCDFADHTVHGVQWVCDLADHTAHGVHLVSDLADHTDHGVQQGCDHVDHNAHGVHNDEGVQLVSDGGGRFLCIELEDWMVDGSTDLTHSAQPCYTLNGGVGSGVKYRRD